MTAAEENRAGWTVAAQRAAAEPVVPAEVSQVRLAVASPVVVRLAAESPEAAWLAEVFQAVESSAVAPLQAAEHFLRCHAHSSSQAKAN